MQNLGKFSCDLGDAGFLGELQVEVTDASPVALKAEIAVVRTLVGHV